MKRKVVEGVDLRKKKKIPIGLGKFLMREEETSAFVDEDQENMGMVFPMYLLDVDGIPCGLTFQFWNSERWMLCDRVYGKVYGEYECFDNAVEALKDSSWIRESFEEANEAAGKSKEEIAEQLAELKAMSPISFVDNPLKGRPEIILRLTIESEDDLLGLYDDDDWDDDDWDDEDEEDEDWDDEDEEDDDLDDEDEEDEDWDDEDEEDDDLDDEDEDDDWDDVGNDGEDDDWGDLWDSDELADTVFEPTAAFVADTVRTKIAFYPVLMVGRRTWWEAFDVQLGDPLWTAPSLTDLMRIAPLFVVMNRLSSGSSEQAFGKFEEYVGKLIEALDGTRQTPENYLETGYLKLNGEDYVRLMKNLSMDSTESAFTKEWLPYGTDEAPDADKPEEDNE